MMTEELPIVVAIFTLAVDVAILVGVLERGLKKIAEAIERSQSR